ncbi:MAG: trigger factor [Pseudomonadales bacterium]|nr:trigger factor [Pseudomonadales bacterium]
MQVTVETTTGLERKLTVGIPADEIDTAVNTKLVDAAKNVKINGFRPGKVPMREVKRRYGKAVREEVLGEVIGAKFYEAVSQEKLNPAGMPHIERKQDEPGLDFQFIATFEVYPEFEIKGLENIEITRYSAEVQDADVDNMIEKLREQRAEFKAVERAAQDGDQVKIDFSGKIDGEEFEGGSAAGHDLVLGSNSMIPGFEAGVEGAKAGEERDVTVTFPEEYHQEDLRGKEAVFTITVHEVQEKTLPEVNEEFIKQFNPNESELEPFKVDVRKNMERELSNALKNKVKQQAMEGLLEQNEIEVPKALVDQEIDRQRKQMVQQFGGGQQFDYSTLPAELFEEQATRSVKLGLLLGEFINVHEIKADADKVRETIEELAQPYEDSEEVIKYYYDNDQQLKQVESLVLEDTAVDKIVAGAQVADETVDYEEAVKPAAAPGAEEE